MTNLIRNGNFSGGTAEWKFFSDVGGTFKAANGWAECTVAGKEGKNVQLYQTGLTLKPGQRYRLTFMASANGNALAWAYIQRHVSPNDSFGLKGGVIAVGADARSFSYTFTTPEGTLDNGRLRLAMNDADPGTVFKFSGFELVEAEEESEPAPIPEEPETGESEPAPEPLTYHKHVIVAGLRPGEVLEVYYVPSDRLVTTESGAPNWDATPWSMVTTYRA